MSECDIRTCKHIADLEAEVFRCNERAIQAERDMFKALDHDEAVATLRRTLHAQDARVQDLERSLSRRTITKEAQSILYRDWPCASCIHAECSNAKHPCSVCRWSPDREDMYSANAGAVPRRGSDVGTSPLLAVSGSGDK